MPASRRAAAHRLSLAALLLLTLAAAAACGKSKAPDAASAAPSTSPTPPNGAAPQEPAQAMSTAASAAPLTVVALGLGNAIGPDKKVLAEVDTFAKTDTIYAAVGTTGAGTGKVTARWSSVAHNGAEKRLSEDSQAISPTADATTEFHISKPEGWAAGDYKIEILLDGKSVATKAYRVGR
jgi:hypothetical protein